MKPHHDRPPVDGVFDSVAHEWKRLLLRRTVGVVRRWWTSRGRLRLWPWPSLRPWSCGRSSLWGNRSFTSSANTPASGYSAATGAQLWIRRYNGPNGGSDVARSLAVSPDGRTVYVTGYSGQTQGPGSGNNDYVTIAYNADSGAQRWLGRYKGRANGNDQGRSVAVSPDGRTVYVTGRSQGRTSSYDYATVAYDAATGAQRWVSRYNGSGHFRDSGRSLAVTPDGRTVIVTGSSWGLETMAITVQAPITRRSPTTRPPVRRAGPGATPALPTTPATIPPRWRSARAGAPCS